MKKRTAIITAIAAFILGLLVMSLVARFAHADFDNNHCHGEDCKPVFHNICRENACVKVLGKGSNQCDDNWDCKPKVSPTPTITPEPSATPTATPTPEQNGGTGVSDGRSDGGRSSDNTPPQPTCNFSFAAPTLQGYSKVDGIQTYSWWLSTDSGITKQSVVYGYAPGDERYGADNLPASQTSIAINGLDNSKTSWLQVWAWKGQCVAKSQWFN